MRTFIISVTIILLFVSGWSHAVAAALCPHASAFREVCSAADSSRHQHEMRASHEMMPMEGMEAASEEAAPVAETFVQTVDADSLSQPAPLCTHCMSHSRLPGAPVFTVTLSRSEGKTETSLPTVGARPVILSAASLAAPFTFRPHAPPGASASRHVLFSVFRI